MKPLYRQFVFWQAFLIFAAVTGLCALVLVGRITWLTNAHLAALLLLPPLSIFFSLFTLLLRGISGRFRAGLFLPLALSLFSAVPAVAGIVVLHSLLEGAARWIAG